MVKYLTFRVNGFVGDEADVFVTVVRVVNEDVPTFDRCAAAARAAATDDAAFVTLGASVLAGDVAVGFGLAAAKVDVFGATLQ